MKIGEKRQKCKKRNFPQQIWPKIEIWPVLYKYIQNPKAGKWGFRGSKKSLKSGVGRSPQRRLLKSKETLLEFTLQTTNQRPCALHTDVLQLFHESSDIEVLLYYSINLIKLSDIEYLLCLKRP